MALVVKSCSAIQNISDNERRKKKNLLLPLLVIIPIIFLYVLMVILYSFKQLCLLALYIIIRHAQQQVAAKRGEVGPITSHFMTSH